MAADEAWTGKPEGWPYSSSYSRDRAFKDWRSDTVNRLRREGWSEDAIDEVVRNERDSVFRK
jgi:hypothetical protein